MLLRQVVYEIQETPTRWSCIQVPYIDGELFVYTKYIMSHGNYEN